MVVLKFYFVVFPHEAISERDEAMDHKQFNIWIAGCWSTEFRTPPCLILQIFFPQFEYLAKGLRKEWLWRFTE